MEGIFQEIAIVIVTAAVLALLFRFLKQPALLAYMLTGILLGPVNLFHFGHFDSLKTLGQLGITLLLFMLGLELKLKELKSIGKTAVIAGGAQMGITFSLALLVARGVGFDLTAAIYLAIALSFSSTIAIVKLLSDKKDLTSLHGKLAIGILLIQDFFAVIAIIFLNNPLGGGGEMILSQILLLVLKVIVIGGWIVVISEYVFPKVLPRISKSPESLFLFSLGWLFAVTAFVASPLIGFSLEIGGFLAGLALANTHENYQIVARMKSLRDFFITIFFVSLGFEMTFNNITSYLFPILLFSGFILLIKPYLISWIIGLMGFKKRTSFFVGVSLGQISEFSLLLLFIGKEKGIFDEGIVSAMILVSMITFVVSTYLIQKTHSLYEGGGKFFFIPQRNKKEGMDISVEGEFDHFKNHIILIGGDTMGEGIIHALKTTKEQVLVVDFNPDIVKKLKRRDISVFFGDIADPEIQERAGFERAKLVISTVPDIEDNLLLLEGLKHANKKATVVVVALDSDDARTLYKAGADYVVMPHLAGGHHVAKILVDKNHLEIIEKYRSRDMEYIS